MAFDGGFSVAQNSESTITLTDTSTGADATITERRIYLFKYDGTTIVPSGTTTTYIVWDIVDGIGDTKALTDIFDKDYAIDIEVIWVTASPDPANTYTVEQLYNFDYYGMLFLAALTTEDSARFPKIVNNTNYRFNKLQFYDFIIQARISVGLMNDINKAQFNLDLAYEMRMNPSAYFGHAS